MLDQVGWFVTVPMVYLAVAWCILGIAYRVARVLKAPAHPHTLKIFPERSAPGLAALIDAFTFPTVLRKAPLFWGVLITFHVAIVLLFLGHLDLFPQVHLMPAESRHMLGAGVVGLLFTLPLFVFLHRRFQEPLRLVSVPADYYLLFLLLGVALTGDSISWTNSWNPPIGFVITKAELATHYFDKLAHLSFASPREGMLVNGHFVVLVIHVLLANLFLMVLPFSRIVHAFFAVAMNRLRRV
jgi:nitrate reductase gamma subunit